MPRTPDPRSPAQPLTIAVVGGGAAGMFAAVNTAEKCPHAQITVYEAGQRPLQKVFISGGGRCNLTHACYDPARLIEFYPRGQKALRALFARFQPRDTVAWFEQRGLRLKTEADGRIFPVSNCSQDVIDTLLQAAQRQGIRLHTGARATRIAVEDGQFRIDASGLPSASYDVCILATGYSPPGWQLAQALGHRIQPPVPSLFPFKIQHPVIDGLAGISPPHPVTGKLIMHQPVSGQKPIRHTADGPILITHTGLSGPVIYRLSAWGARDLAETGYQAQLVLDWLPHWPEEDLRQHLSHLFATQDAKRKLGNTAFPELPNRLWLSLLNASGFNLDDRASQVSKKQIHQLIEALKRLTLPVSGKSPSKEEFVSCGGIPLSEVDFKTMQSRRVPGLYLGGEILDIDGLTGGFNFQACWSAGWVISDALAAASCAPP